MTEEQLSALLRLKRFEQPPEGYFDQLLKDVHRRQRAELLRRPLWRIALDRVQTFFGEHSMSSVSYAGAMAAVLVVGVGGIRLMTPSQIVHNPPEPPNPPHPPIERAERYLSLSNSAPAPKLDASLSNVSQPNVGPMMLQPRYVIDAKPVSYEPPSSFKF